MFKIPIGWLIGGGVAVAKAEKELDALSRKYKNLSTRAVDLDVCQTYELALAALAGEETQ